MKLTQLIGYAKYFDSNKTMSFKVVDQGLLKKHTKIWGRINGLIGKEFDSEPVYDDNDKNIKTKMNLPRPHAYMPYPSLIRALCALPIINTYLRAFTYQ